MIQLYAAAFLTGIFAAMGVGGGMILIIYLTFFAGFTQLEAQGINLVYFIPVALLSVIIHTKNKLISWKKILPSLVAGTAAAAAGAWAAAFIGSDMLKKIFGGFILIIGIKELLFKESNSEA
ncbi:MAG: sulfite exporter TauE/SafE family protein [Oscillospiraceae bacterium]|nr:sulfite exporter TauE/SafE family protein [Oscillospiraceae bacterium]